MSVSIERHEGVGTIYLDRPERRNAIDGPLGIALAQALAVLGKDDSVNVLVLAGRGNAFCSGLDLKAFNADPPPPWLAEFKSIWRNTHRELFNCPKPIIGALERYAINGGAALALACDLLVVGREAFLHVGEARLGMGAPYNIAWMRMRLPETAAMQLALTARRFSGQELVRMGVASECVDDDAVLTRAQALAAELSAFPAGGLERIKRMFRRYAPTLEADPYFDLAFLDAGGGAPPPTLETQQQS